MASLGLGGASRDAATASELQVKRGRGRGASRFSLASRAAGPARARANSQQAGSRESWGCGLFGERGDARGATCAPHSPLVGPVLGLKHELRAGRPWPLAWPRPGPWWASWACWLLVWAWAWAWALGALGPGHCIVCHCIPTAHWTAAGGWLVAVAGGAGTGTGVTGGAAGCGRFLMANGPFA
jgi:hypothetical protein